MLFIVFDRRHFKKSYLPGMHPIKLVEGAKYYIVETDCEDTCRNWCGVTGCKFMGVWEGDVKDIVKPNYKGRVGTINKGFLSGQTVKIIKDHPQQSDFTIMFRGREIVIRKSDVNFEEGR